jgi:type IV secretion system protein VirB10
MFDLFRARVQSQQQTAGSSQVTAPVRPPMTIGGKLVGGIAIVLFFLFWLLHSAEPTAKPTVKTTGSPSSVGTVTPDSGSSGYGLAKRLADARMLDASLSRENQRLADEQRQHSEGAANATAVGGQTPAEAARERAIQRAEKERERIWESRFASGLMSAAKNDTPEVGKTDLPATVPPVASVAAGGPTPRPTPSAATEQGLSLSTSKRRDCLDITDGPEKLYAICEGYKLSAVSAVRLNGDFAGPVEVMLDQDVMSGDRQHLLLPKGTKVFGKAAAVDKAYQQRLSATFHRVLLPNGQGYALAGEPALEPAGDMALRDKVDRHLASKFSAAIILGGLAGFAQAGTGSVLTAGGLDMYRQSLAQQGAMTGQMMVGQQMSRPNGITIREGHAMVIALSEDLHVPEYLPPAVVTTFGGGEKR